MSTSAAERKAILGKFVQGLFPKVMQYILKEHISPRGLQVKYSLKDIHIALTDSEISLMEKLPNLDEFTVELCYKILRYEHLIYEPKCKWGNVPCNTDVDIADDIQRILNLTNEVIGKISAEIQNDYYEDFQKKTQEVLKRIDTYLVSDLCLELYHTICNSDTNNAECISKLADVQPINVNSIIDEDMDEKREWVPRLSLVVQEIFPKILRSIIKSLVSAGLLYQMCKPHMNSFTTAQQNSLKELQSSNSYDSLDITLMYKLIRQFVLIAPPTKGWGKVPVQSDITLGDDVERIRQYRNQIAHRLNMNFSKDEYEDYFNKFRAICHRIDINFETTNYENEIIELQNSRMDMKMKVEYENAIKKLEDITLRYEKRPIKFYWGDSFEKQLMNLRSMLKEEKLEGKEKVNIQIIFQNEDDVENSIEILNSLKDEINKGLTAIELIVASKGSLILNVYILLEIIETDKILLSTLTSFVEKILEYNTTTTTKSVDILVLPVEEYATWNTAECYEEFVDLDFNIEVRFFETDDKMKEQFNKIFETILHHSKGKGKNPNLSALVLANGSDQIAILLTKERNDDSNKKYLSDKHPPTKTEAKTDEKSEILKTQTDCVSRTGKQRKLKPGKRTKAVSRSLSCCQLNKSKNLNKTDWFYKLDITCDNYSLHLINDVNVLRKFDALSEAVQSKGHKQYRTYKKSTTVFEEMYLNMKGIKNLSTSECIKQNFDLEARFLLARDIPPAELCKLLLESMKENRNSISKAIGWTISKQFWKVIPRTDVMNGIIDVWPGYHCRCGQHCRKSHSRICSTEPVIIVEVDQFSNTIPNDFYGIPVKQSFQELRNEHTQFKCHEEKTDVSSHMNTMIQTPISIPGELAEMYFKQHSKMTMIHVHPLRRRSIQLWSQIKGVIPMGEAHFPKMINGIDTCIDEGHVKFMAKIKVGDTIGFPGSTGTLGGFVQMHGYNAFLTCAHVVHNTETLFSGNKRERHKTKTVVFCVDTLNSNSGVECGYVLNEVFDYNNANETSVDAAVVVLNEENVKIDENDILNKSPSGPVKADFLGMQGPYLNDNYITPNTWRGTLKAKCVGMTSGYSDKDVTFQDYEKDDDQFKNKPHGLSLYFKHIKDHVADIKKECPLGSPAIPYEVHFQQLVVQRLGDEMESGRLNFRFFNQLLLENFVFEQGDSGTCIYVVEDKTIVRSDNQPNQTGCLAMAIASFYDSNERRNKCIATPMKAILKKLGLI